jgi:hypothetical protein
LPKRRLGPVQRAEQLERGALTRIASATGHAYALGVLANAIGETALLEGDADSALARSRRRPLEQSLRSESP